MAFVRIWSKINFRGTSNELPVGPVDSTFTVKSVEVAPFYCITVFEGANYTGTFKTYFSNSVDTSSFSVIKSIIVQDSLVPYHIDYYKTVLSANQNETFVALSRYINLHVDISQTDTQFIYLQKDKASYELVVTGINSIVIPTGFYAKFTDNNGQSITFYNSVYFIDAFKDLIINPFSSTSTIKNMEVLMKNPPCSITDPCQTCPVCQTCPTCPTCETCAVCQTCPTCETCATCQTCGTCETCEKPPPCATTPTCYFPCSDILSSMNIVFIVGVVFAAVFVFTAFFSFKPKKQTNTHSQTNTQLHSDHYLMF